jgi:hypothetical protein
MFCGFKEYSGDNVTIRVGNAQLETFPVQFIVQVNSEKELHLFLEDLIQLFNKHDIPVPSDFK